MVFEPQQAGPSGRGAGAHRGSAVAVIVTAAALALAGLRIVELGNPAERYDTEDGRAVAAREVLAAASARTQAEGTARTAMVETISGTGKTAKLRFDGANDYKRKAATLTMSVAGRDFESIRVVDGVTYISAPTVPLPGNAHWLSVRPSDLGLPADQSMLGSNDPNTGLRYLSAVSGAPRELGTATIGGVTTRHYSLTLDLKSYLSKESQAASNLGALGLGQLDGLTDLTKIPAQAWIDDAGRVRQFEITFAVSQGEQSVKAVSVINFSHFDEPVSITAPESTDTVPFSQFPTFFQKLSNSGNPV